MAASLRKLRMFHDRVREGFGEFLHLEVSGSLMLLAATVVALVITNSSAAEWWAGLWHTEIGLSVGTAEFSQSALHWLDDGLMALFFFVVGLEIKREILVGELSSVRKAALPVLAAVGGMVGPALVYTLFNYGTEGARGWGVPMATDIAFALGIMAMLGSRVPTSLKIFMAALAIADDIGAVIVIAIFYTAQVLPIWLLVAMGLMLFIVLFNVLGVESPIPYWIFGSAVWFAMYNSGIHATIAGVMVALAVPTGSRMQPMEFVDWARRKIDEIAQHDVPGEHVLQTPHQQHCAQEIQAEARWIQAPLQRMEHAILPVSTFIILPLFALGNAGVSFRGLDISGLVTEPVSLGIFFGLIAGKQLGIFGATWAAVKLGLADLPSGVRWMHIWGASALGGVGFTMALFIAGLAFRVGFLQSEAKLAILITSIVAGVIGYVILRKAGSEAVEAVDSADAAGLVEAAEAQV